MERREIDALALELEACTPVAAPTEHLASNVAGTWRLLYTTVRVRVALPGVLVVCVCHLICLPDFRVDLRLLETTRSPSGEAHAPSWACAAR